MSKNKYIFNILDFFNKKKYEQKMFTKIWKSLKNDCDSKTCQYDLWPTVSQMPWPLAQQEWNKKQLSNNTLMF